MHANTLIPSAHPQRVREKSAVSDTWNALVLRFSAVVAQAGTIWITWPLWTARHYDPAQVSPVSPMLPAFPLPQFDVFPWLLGSLVLVLFAPRWGVVLHGAMLFWAILLDQIRMQPECISLWVLMLGSLNSPGLKLLARSHLIALWFFAGFHKLISPGYYEAVVPFMAGRSPGDSPVALQVLGGMAALFEIALAVLAIFPRTRRLCAVVAAPFHLAVSWWLAFHLHWNESVCPWNAAIAVAGFTLIWPWRSSFREDWRDVSRPARVAVAFVLFSPLLFYVGLFDPFMSYCIYSSNVPEAWIVVPGGESIPISSLLGPELNVAIPPEHRLFEAYFEQVGQPGDKLIIEDPRWWARFRGYDHREIVKRAAGATPK
ncbi:MAG TPA: hypothetical protein VG056_17465 [Pirellulales bacterium]|jgi:hypothetical protein|nr:hypothetical protein [Pirellulales bacterium]